MKPLSSWCLAIAAVTSLHASAVAGYMGGKPASTTTTPSFLLSSRSSVGQPVRAAASSNRAFQTKVWSGQATAITTLVAPSPYPWRMQASSSSDDDDTSSSSSSSNDTNDEPPSPDRRTPPLPPRAMDPLFAAVTRMDEATQAAAPSVRIPLWGDLILDRSLFLLVPLVGFAVGGILLSLYILVNSGDAVAEAVAENARQQSIPTTVMNNNNNECRGLCSSQAKDLEGLRNYMSGFGK